MFKEIPFEFALFTTKSRFLILLNNNVVKLQPIGMWVRKEIGTLTFCVAGREAPKIQLFKGRVTPFPEFLMGIFVMLFSIFL